MVSPLDSGEPQSSAACRSPRRPHDTLGDSRPRTRTPEWDLFFRPAASSFRRVLNPAAMWSCYHSMQYRSVPGSGLVPSLSLTLVDRFLSGRLPRNAPSIMAPKRFAHSRWANFRFARPRWAPPRYCQASISFGPGIPLFKFKISTLTIK
jgi:hypothetical protein